MKITVANEANRNIVTEYDNVESIAPMMDGEGNPSNLMNVWFSEPTYITEFNREGKSMLIWNSQIISKEV